ncbi:MAG: polysaccharide deacetylase family protein [Armatimonadetes bacterium]|nr:polysaccharide deacetylase family protein [Armatimonadota bacterium]
MTGRAGAASLLLAAVIVGCGQDSPAPSPADKQSTDQPEQTTVARVTDRPGNADGVVLIVMYHSVTEHEGSYARSRENFRKDLQRLYDLGFRPVTLGEYVDDTMDLPPGASPVVITWDDSNRSQFRYLDDGSIDPDCAVGIWKQFAEEHSDFPVRGSFYVLKNGPFGADGTKKVAQLLEWGCEVDTHTIRHPNLAKLTDAEVMRELAEAQRFVRGLGSEPRVLSLPFGIRPKNRELLQQFEHEHETYSHIAALMVGAGPALSPNDPDRDLYRLPRIQAFDGEYGLTYWLDLVEAGKTEPYVQA